MTPALWSDAYNEVLSTGGLPIGFDSTAEAERVAALYPAARMRVIDVQGPTFPAVDDLLHGRLTLAHRED